jgi:hypothetical protein
MIQGITWYKFESETPKEGGRPQEWKLVLVQDDRLKNPCNQQGIGLGFCWGYDMDVTFMDKDGHFNTLTGFRPAFWASLGNDDPKDIFEKPQYRDVKEPSPYPEYSIEFKFRERGRKRKLIEMPEEAEELDLDEDDELDLDDENLF